MRKILLLLFWALIPISTFADAVLVDGLYYNLSESSAEVTKMPEGKYSGDIVIPSSITYNTEEYSVTSIGNEAFKECNEVTSVVIPNTVVSIGDFAFDRCYAITSFNLPNSITSIGNWAFANTNITEIDIPTTVKSIGYSAFNSCRSLTSVTLPGGISRIPIGLFEDCN